MAFARAAQRDVDLGRGPEDADRVLAFLQRPHAIDLGSDRLPQRQANRAWGGGAAGLAQNAIGALSWIQFRGIRRVQIAFLPRIGHRADSLMMADVTVRRRTDYRGSGRERLSDIS
ncbi:MAG: hypothetical protein ACREX7_02145 [Casimicrobiaceae bacterium]